MKTLDIKISRFLSDMPARGNPDFGRRELVNEPKRLQQRPPVAASWYKQRVGSVDEGGGYLPRGVSHLGNN